MEADGIHVLMLPGPPRECEMMFRHRAVPYLKGLSEGVIVSRTVKTCSASGSPLPRPCCGI